MYVLIRTKPPKYVKLLIKTDRYWTWTVRLKSTHFEVTSVSFTDGGVSGLRVPRVVPLGSWGHKYLSGLSTPLIRTFYLNPTKCFM